MTDREQTFSPDWASPPGDTIIDLMEEKDWTKAELARRLGFTTGYLNQLLKGNISITQDSALRLERVLGSSAKFWLNREAIYRERLASLDSQQHYQSRVG